MHARTAEPFFIRDIRDHPHLNCSRKCDACIIRAAKACGIPPVIDVNGTKYASILIDALAMIRRLAEYPGRSGVRSLEVLTLFYFGAIHDHFPLLDAKHAVQVLGKILKHLRAEARKREGGAPSEL